MTHSILYLTIFTILSKTFGSFIDDPKDFPQTTYPSYDSSKFYSVRRYYGMYFIISRYKGNYDDNFCEDHNAEKVFIKQDMDLIVYKTAACKLRRQRGMW